MRNATARLIVVVTVAMASGLAFGQPADPNAPAAPPPPPPGVVQVMPMGPGGMAMRVGGPMFARDALAGVIATLGEVNLSPGFELSAEQKQKIQAIRDEFKSAMEQWRSEHADDLKALDEQQKALFDNMQAGNPPDPDQMRELMEARGQLMETAPNGQEQADQVKALLTPDQLKKFEEKQAALDAEREEMMQRMPMRFGRNPGPPPAPGSSPPADKGKGKDR